MKILKSILLCTAVMAMIISCQPTKTTGAAEEAQEAVEQAVEEIEQVIDEEEVMIEVELNKDAMLINKTWRLTGITFYQKDQILLPGEKDRGITVKFMADGKLSYKLSVNSCFGNYNIKGETMQTKLGGCTKMCCDSEFATDFQSVLKTAKSYKIHDDKYLEINGEDKILKFELAK